MVFQIFLSNAVYGLSGFAKKITPCNGFSDQSRNDCPLVIQPVLYILQEGGTRVADFDMKVA